MAIKLKNIQYFFEEYIFRRDYERTFLLYLTIGNIFVLGYSLPILSIILSSWFLSFFFIGFPLIYFLLLPKIIRQYKRKHLNSDIEKWESGLKGKLIVIFRWLL
jgi:hypothetical protein